MFHLNFYVQIKILSLPGNEHTQATGLSQYNATGHVKPFYVLTWLKVI